MRLLVVLLALAALAAGCVTPATKLQPNVVAIKPAAGGDLVGLEGVAHDSAGKLLPLALGAPRLLGGEYLLPASSTEPSIGADGKGGVYMTGSAHSGVTGSARGTPTIWATFDNGQTFKDVGPKLPTGDGRHVNSNDPIVYVDPETNRVFDDDILPISCGTMSWSDDKGANWMTNPYACGNSNVNDHQTVAASKARSHPTVGYPKVIYRCTNNGAESGCAMSFTGGLSFTPQVPVFVSPRDGCAGLTAHLRAGPDGKMYLPKADCPGGPTIMVTADDGITWTPIHFQVEHKATDHELGLGIDANNAMYVTWESKGRVYYSASPDAGKTWLPERDITAPGVTATMFNSLAVGAPGKVAFAYLGSTVPGGYEGKGKGNAGLNGDLMGQPKLPEWDNATWNAYMGVITDALDPTAPIQSVTTNDPADPLARGLCGGTRCHGMNDFIEITIDSNGRPWASFVDVCTQKCVTDPTVQSDKVFGAMMTVRDGPNLRSDGASALASLLPQVTKPS